MGWESRGGRRYYYDARRVGGRVVKTYVGAGPAAAAVSRLNDLDREKKTWAKIDRELVAAGRARGGRAAGRWPTPFSAGGWRRPGSTAPTAGRGGGGS